MKVLHIAPAFPPTIGGVETFVAELATWQAANGFEVAIIAGSAESEEREAWASGVHVRRLPFGPVLSAQDMERIAALGRRMTELVATEAPHVVHLHPVAAEMLFMRNLLRTGAIKAVASLHMDVGWQPVGYRANLEALLAGTAAIAAVSERVLLDTKLLFPELANKIQLVENGLAWQDGPDTESASGHFLYLGRLVPEKGVDVALRALSLLVEVDPTIHLTIAGDGAERPALEALTDTLRLQGSVTFLGQVERRQVPMLMARHMALLMPSRWQEPFGLVVLEAAMANRPTIVSTVGALPTLVRHAVTGLHVEPDAPEALATAMLDMTQAPEQTRKMGRAAAKHAALKWSITRAGESYRRIYEEVACGAAC